MPNDDDFLNSHLMENLDDDPYGTATYVIRRTLGAALNDRVNGSMSQREYDTLDALAKMLTALDPAAVVNRS